MPLVTVSRFKFKLSVSVAPSLILPLFGLLVFNLLSTFLKVEEYDSVLSKLKSFYVLLEFSRPFGRRDPVLLLDLASWKSCLFFDISRIRFDWRIWFFRIC